jgi:hypothetical protein
MPTQGCIDAGLNPFSRDSWITQGFGLTDKRAQKLAIWLGKDVSEILAYRPENDGRYPAFVGIRWGFAEIIDGKLMGTEKWRHRNSYDAHSFPI